MSEHLNFHISNLSTCEHSYSNYHFCRGNSNKRKSRFGLVEAGHAVYIYLNEKIEVSEGDIIFIPENIFCYSEWFGEPDIRVFYISCNMEYDSHESSYCLQKLQPENDELRQIMRNAHTLLSGDFIQKLEAHSLFYQFLAKFIPLIEANHQKLDSTLYKAIEYITQNWNSNFSVFDISKYCSVCESTLYHLFKEQLGITPVSYLNAIKVNYAMQYLENSNASISTICAMTNFHSETYFRKVFRSITGFTPSDYRKKNCQL